MHFANHIPAESLAPYIDSLFHFQHFQPDHSLERVVPDGHTYLIFELDGMTRSVFDNQTLQPRQQFTRAWFSGMHRHYLSISAHPDSEMVVVRFKPGGASRWLTGAMSELDDRVVPAQVLWGPSVLELRDDLIASSDDAELFERLESFLLKRVDTADNRGWNCIRQITDAIDRNSEPQLKQVVDNSGYSSKQAISLFNQHVGLTPKIYQRIRRFQEILPRVQKQQSIRWQDICRQCYYYDQSHFIREFKAFCGYSPSEFLCEQGQHPEPNFFPLDREENADR